MKSTFIIFIIGFLLYSCSESTNLIDDGTYCAKLEYYNPKTEHVRTWHLPIVIEDNKLIKIKFPNGGWMDDSHFNPPEIFEGTFEFENDKGYIYEVSEITEDCD